MIAVLIALAILLAIIGAAGWLFLREPRTQATQLDHELDAAAGILEEDSDEDYPTLLAVPPADLVGTISDDSAGADAGYVAAEVVVSGTDEDAAGTQMLLGAVAGGSGLADVAVAVRVRLTPAQRRRALHKGRIPRDLPGPVPDRPAPVRAGELDDLTGLESTALTPVLGVSADCDRVGEVHHERHERIPQPLEVWDPLMHEWMPVFPTLLESARHEAHFRQWESEIGALINGAYGWLEQVPA